MYILDPREVLRKSKGWVGGGNSKAKKYKGKCEGIKWQFQWDGVGAQIKIVQQHRGKE